MYLPIFIVLMTVLSTSLAVPTAPPTQLPTTTNFTVRAFYASIASLDAPEEYQQQSWADFVIQDGSYGTLCSAITEPNQPIYSDYKYYPCDVNDLYPDVLFSFKISKDFKEVEVKKSWDSNGIYLTGFATQATDWTEGEGGNVTAAEYGKFYERFGQWDFEITRLIG